METQTNMEDVLAKRCLERLGDATSRGLAENVLIASLQHRCKDELGNIYPAHVRRALKDLKASGRVTHSAGRWRRLR